MAVLCGYRNRAVSRRRFFDLVVLFADEVVVDEVDCTADEERSDEDGHEERYGNAADFLFAFF